MKWFTKVSLMMGIAVAGSHAIGANAPCDANVPIKGCRAEIALEGNFVVLKSNTPNCSVIEWTIDGRGRQTTVIDGEERLEVLTTRPKELMVESCTQVKDLRAIARSEEGSSGVVQASIQPDFERHCRKLELVPQLATDLSTHWRCAARDGNGTFIWCKNAISSEPTARAPPTTGSALSPAQGERYTRLLTSKSRTPAEEREFSELRRILNEYGDAIRKRMDQFVASRCG